uniref:Smx5 n=1 Tax=Oryzias sinensis TaxID=183150 RepID=A0A8C7Y104_9TELE
MCSFFSSGSRPASHRVSRFHALQLSVKNCFIRGSVVRYVQLPADEVDTQLLQDAARKEAMQQKQ